MNARPRQPARPTRPTRRRRAAQRRSAQRRWGTATVEFAFSASIVFMLFLAMIEVARFHIVRHSMDQAVYMGAREAIIPGRTAEQAETIVNDRLSAAGVVGATVTIAPAVIDSTTEAVTIRASADYEQNSWALPKFFGGMSVNAEITLDHENVAFD